MTEWYIKEKYKLYYRDGMAMVSIRLSDELNQSLDKMVEEGLFKDKTDAMHEAVRMMMLKYDDFQLQ